MATDSIIFLLLATSLIVFAMLLIVIVVMFAESTRKYGLLKKDLNQKSNELLEETRHKAFQIIEEANIKAGQVIAEANDFDKKWIFELNQKLQEVSDQDIQNLKNILTERLIKYKMTLDMASKNSVDLLTSRSKEIEQDLEGKISAEFETAKKQIEEYKAAKMAKIENSISEIIKKASLAVIGKAIDAEKHEQLVIKALDEAKKEIV